jgi:predicted DNA binding CopG/RHH family protein
MSTTKSKGPKKPSSKKDVLDAYEQDIENNYDTLKPTDNQKELISSLKTAAKKHVQRKKPITIRLSIEDIEAIKIKADKLGLPYQTYLNMIIHKDATN